MGDETRDGKARGKRRGFSATFYAANVMEIFERLAWYGIYAVVTLYMTGKVEDGGLGFTDEQQGTLIGVVTFILYLLPVLTGGLADRYGFKRMFALAYAILVPSYFLLGHVRSFGGFFAVFLVVALGAAIFKPLVVGTVARETDDENRSMGFGVFYLMVNIGGFVGPIVAGIIRDWGWSWVFAMSSVWIGTNFLWLFVLYRERKGPAEDNPRSLKQVLSDMVGVLGNFRLFLLLFGAIVLLLAAGNEWLGWLQVGVAAGGWLVVNVLYDLVVRDRFSRSRHAWLIDRMRLGDWRFGLFLFIVSGFWTAFNQIFMTMPKYIRDYVDTTPVVGVIRSAFTSLGQEQAGTTVITALTENGQIKPEMIVNIDAGSIILFQLLVSLVVKRLNPFATMVGGVLVGAAGLSMSALGGASPGVSIWICALGILVFSFGEMSASPTSQEYIGKIAPEGREGLYMGYYFVAMALGNLFGGVLSGPVYGAVTRDLGRPDLFWALSGGVGILTAVSLLLFNFLAVRRSR